MTLSKKEAESVRKLAKKIVRHSFSGSRKDKKSDQFPNWYAGITNNPKTRLVGHKSKNKVDDLKHFKPFDAKKFKIARAVEEYLCDHHGFSHCKSRGGAQDDSKQNPSKWVYTYNLPSHLR